MTLQLFLYQVLCSIKLNLFLVQIVAVVTELMYKLLFLFI